jgi:hypothetical protein
MGGFSVEPGALTARAGAADTAARDVSALAGSVGEVATGGMPPRTGAALESALSAWPGALRKLGSALSATGSAFRTASSVYGSTEQAIRKAADGTP